MNRDIEFLEGIWIRMLDAGMVQSKGQFSTEMLGKAPSYLTSMAARDRNIPFEVFDALADEVKRASEAEALRIEDLESKLLAMLRGQKVREMLLSNIVDHQCEKSDAALDMIIERDPSDTFLSKVLKHAGLARIA